MRHPIAIAVLSLCAALAGCTHTYELDRLPGPTKIGRDARVYVAEPEPGKYDVRPYTESGRQTRDAIAQAFAGRVSKVDVGVKPERKEAALASARQRGATLAVVTVIEHWEERATEWTGKPDRIELRIEIFDVATGALVDSAFVSGKSRWATLGSDHPQDLLPRAVGDYVAELFPATDTATAR
jgi:hypothetical protein